MGFFSRLLGRAGLYFSVLVLISPAILFFLIFQRTLTRGVTAGAVK